MRAIRARKKDNVARDRAFSSSVLTRDGRLCRMQRWTGKWWSEHGIKGSPYNPIDPVHIYSRARIANEDVHFEAIVGVAGCRDCHDRYDLKIIDGIKVRVPPERESAAWRFLVRQQALGVLTQLPSRNEPPANPSEVSE